VTRRSDDRLVWSSQGGDQRKTGKPGAASPAPRHAPLGGPVRVGRETKGRKGKGVTTVSGVPLAGAALEELAGELKRRCGSGGTVREGVIEIQGDHRDELVELLAARGWRVVRAGG
jgi:translation initiation factor 1